MDDLSPDFVAELFEAALDDAAWQGVAQKVARACGVEGGAIIAMRGNELLDISVTENIFASAGPYESYYKLIDPWRTRAKPTPPGSIRLSSELFSEDELVRGEFYNDFAKHVGMFRPLNAYLRTDEGIMLSVGVEEPFARRLLDYDDKPRLARIAGYLTRAVSLRLRLRAAEQRAAAGWSIIEQWDLATLICDGAGAVMAANRAGEAMLAVPLPEEVLPHIHAAANGGSGGSLVLSEGGRRRLVLVTPLPRQIDETRGLALVTMREAEARSFDASLLMRLFGLSATQAALAIAIYDGMSPDDFAVLRDIRISTVRTHLGNLLERVGVADQRGLIAVLGRIPPIRWSG